MLLSSWKSLGRTMAARLFLAVTGPGLRIETELKKDHSSSPSFPHRLADSKDLFVGNSASIVVKLKKRTEQKKALDYREIMLM